MNAVIFFCRYPEKGAVKTKIASICGDDFTLGLYKNFIRDILETCDRIDADIIIIFHSENKTEIDIPFLKGYKYFNQQGSDLGERMYNAFNKVFENLGELRDE